MYGDAKTVYRAEANGVFLPFDSLALYRLILVQFYIVITFYAFDLTSFFLFFSENNCNIYRVASSVSTATITVPYVLHSGWFVKCSDC